jgi:hypothetical protein
VIYVGKGFVISPVDYPAWWFDLLGGGRYAVHCRLPERRRRTG